ncbi:Protein Y92H12BR.3 a [Aphelenchoides avenae]|nr:Protein Y92H12BR.3 a [Aphelenchus avenae]
MPVRNGVQSLHVVACMHNLTTDGTTHLEVDLTYAGPKAEQQPYSKDFKNPSIFTVNIILYQDTNTTSNDSKVTILEHVSFDVVTLEKTDSIEKQNALMQPRGVYCTNMEKKALPAHFPERFEADIEFTNIAKKTVDTIELMYDESQRIVVFAFDADKDADVPFLVNASALLPKEKRVRVVHDFNYGLEYVLSKDGRECYHVNPIQTAWADVNYTNSIIYMRSPSQIILEDASADAYYAGKVAPRGHQEFELYVSKKVAPDGECVIEFLYNTEDWSIENVKQQSLHAIVQYHKDNTGKIVGKSITTVNSLRNNTQMGSSWTRHNVYPCLTDSLSENFFFVTIEKASMKSLKQIGVGNVESSLAEAISQVANISVLRISQFLIRISKKTRLTYTRASLWAKPDNATAQTAYHREQKSVKEVHEILNATLGSHSLKVTVVKDNLETATLNLGGFGTISPSTEPHPPPSFNGYSGGSMFVLAIFSFIFGSLIAVGSYVFYHKRQAIRGMAYQVFE